MVKKILNIAFWVLFTIVMGIWLIDFFRVQNSKEPMFCLNKTEHKFDDGKVYECTGLGYKVYTYDRSSMEKAVQFGPFFVSMKEPK